jgi:hypothetical protein
MSATIDPVRATIARLNERRNIAYADIVALLDMLIEQKFSEYVCDMRRHGLSAREIEDSIEIQTEMAREWKAETLREVHETFFGGSGNGPVQQ